MRKVISTLLAITLLFSISTVFGQASTIIDQSNLAKGVVAVQNPVSDKQTRVMVEKDGKRYTYTLQKDHQTTFPLQLGNGEYRVSLLENTTGNKFKVLSRETINLQLKNEQVVFLNSVQNVNWDDSMKAIKKAKELTKTAKTDEEKIRRIYQYIVSNVQYDFDKKNTVKAGYIPVIDDVFNSNKGICYDYSSLFAAMLRSVGVPTKLVMGHTTLIDEYHAWNEVFVNGKWVIVDLTIDASLLKSKKKTEMIKNKKDYKTSFEY